MQEQLERRGARLDDANYKLSCAEREVMLAQREVATAREHLATAELKLDRRTLEVEQLRAVRDAAALDDLAAAAPPLTEVERELLRVRGLGNRATH